MPVMIMKKILVLWLSLACLICASLLPATTYAVNFAAGAKPEPGYQLKLYPFYYAADIRTDKDGEPAVTGLGLKKYGVSIGNFYQIGDLQLNAIIPVGKLEIGKLKER